MDRRDFHKQLLALGFGAPAGLALAGDAPRPQQAEYYQEPPRKLPVRRCDVVVAGAGTAGVVAALAAARQGAHTVLIERKGYPGGTVTEGGTALHSYYNLWKAFPGVAKRQVVRGIPQEIVDRLAAIGGTSTTTSLRTDSTTAPRGCRSRTAAPTVSRTAPCAWPTSRTCWRPA